MRIQPAIISEAPLDEEEKHDTSPDPEPETLNYNDKIRQSIQVGSFEEQNDHSGGLI